MKKFLSLVLALVMTMSLVTVSAGAKDFTDNDKITYVEAVDVMSEIGVIDGYTTGDFKPTATLTRGAAAKIICNLILGPTTANALATTTAPYSDVAADSTFAGYIAYLAKEGIIGGYADGTFKPGNSLTGYAFLKMLLGALGYDADIEGYTGANYSVSVAKQAIEAGLTKGLAKEFDGRPAVTREEACLYAFNTLKAIMVEYDNRIVVGEGSTAVAISGVRKDLTWNKGTKNDGNIENDGFVQFAEQYFPNLSVETGNGMYGRPANTWKLKKVEIGTYTSIEPTIVYTEEMKEKDVYSDLGKVACTEYDWTAFVNGKEIAAKDVDIPTKSDDKYSYTKEGAVAEIYVDDDAETVTVVMINNYLGEVTKVKSDDDGEYITVKSLLTGDKAPTLNDKTFYVEGYKEDDYVVFTVDYDEDEKEFVIGEVVDPEVVTGTVSRVETDKATGSTYLRVDGEKNTYSTYIVYDLGKLNTKDHPELTKEYDLYLDPNGYVLAFEKTEEDASKYLYVKDADEHLGTWEAKVVLADGSTETVELKKELKKVPTDTQSTTYTGKGYKAFYQKMDGDDSIIAWTGSASYAHASEYPANITDRVWKYSVNDKGVYTLTFVDNCELKNGEIKNGKAYISEGKNDFIVDNETAFVDVDGKTAYEGYKSVPSIEKVEGLYVMDGKIVDVLFILDGEIYDKDSTYFFLTKDSRESLKYDGDYYWDYSKAYVNGEKQSSLYVAYDALNAKETALSAGVLYQAKKTIEDSEGNKYITEVVAVDLIKTPFNTVNAVGAEAFWLTTAESKTVKYDVNDETIFVLVEKNAKDEYTVSVGDINDMKKQDGYTTTVCVVEKDDETAELVYILVVEGKSASTGKTEYQWDTDAAGVTWKWTDAAAKVGLIYVGDKYTTVAQLATAAKATDAKGVFYVTVSGITVQETVDEDSTATVASVLEQEGASLTITNANGTWTVVTKK